MTESGQASGVTAPVLIAGGYGLVGGQVAELLRDGHPGLPLVLGGRTPANGQALAERLGSAACAPVDLSSPGDPLAGLPELPAAVLVAVNDPHDALLLSALGRGIPYVDITRWTALVRRAVVRAAVTPPRAPVILASGWMGGVIPLLAARSVAALGDVERVDISIRYALADRSGPNSVEYMDRLADRFETTAGGQPVLVSALSDGRKVRFADGSSGRVQRIDTPEQLTLPAVTGVRTVATRIGFDDSTSTAALAVMRRLGLLRLLASERLTPLRRSLLHRPGEGGPALARIDLAGPGGTRTIQIHDPAGQSHLTAVGALIALERALGLDGAPPEPPGVRFPEQMLEPERALATLRRHGVGVTEEQPPA